VEATPPQEPPGPITGNLRLIAESPLPPTALVITVEGQEFLQLGRSGTGADIDVEQAWVYPPGGLKVELRAEWLDYLPGPRAVRVRALFDGVLISDSSAWGRDKSLEKTWHLPGAEEILRATTAETPEEFSTPGPGESDPARRPPNEATPDGGERTAPRNPAGRMDGEGSSANSPGNPPDNGEEIFSVPPR
jgi:hypothetical protein